MRGLIAHYPLCEETGLVARDLTVNKNNGQLLGDVTWAKPGANIGTTESRIVSAAAGIFPAAAGSIELLFKPTWNNDDGVVHYFFDTWGGAEKRFMIEKSSDNLLYLYTNGLDRGTVSYPFAAGSVYHLFLNWGINKLYVNSSLAKDYADGGLGNGASTLYIGDRYIGANRSLNGLLYYFRVRDVVLTETEILYFYNQAKKMYGV